MKPPPPPAPPTILEGVGWKRRSGFGKYSDTLYGGSSWERRRLVLTAAALAYYEIREPTGESTGEEDRPRGTLNILNERATVSAAYSGDSSQPTPYAVVIRTPDGMGSDAVRWKLCFDERETQMFWVVALTDIVAQASVREYNARVLADEKGKVDHGGFHRLYEEGVGRMLDLVHAAVLSGEGLVRGQAKQQSKPKKAVPEESIEVVARGNPSKDIQIMSTQSNDASLKIRSTPRRSFNDAFSNASGETEKRENEIPIKKMYQALAVVVVCLFYEKNAERSSALLWKLANIAMLCICFGPTKRSRGGAKKEGSLAKNELDARRRELTPSMKVVAESNETEEAPPLKSPVRDPTVEDEPVQAGGCLLETWDNVDQEAEETPRVEDPALDEMCAHERWAVSAPNVDLSGEWTLIADDAFNQEYNTYLKLLGFNRIVRKVACSLIGNTTEVTRQSDNGRELYLKGTNPKGSWERTLRASGYPDFETQPERKEGEDYSHERTPIKTADSEDVVSEAWWEERGTKHRSWLRGGKKYGGGDFESLRYLEDGGCVLVCESIFHPTDAGESAAVTWRFRRDGAANET